MNIIHNFLFYFLLIKTMIMIIVNLMQGVDSITKERKKGTSIRQKKDEGY